MSASRTDWPVVWFAASLVLLVWPLANLDSAAGNQDSAPRTPIDLTHPGYAAQWRFLASAKPHLPPLARVTAVGPDRDAEATLFFMSLGLFREQLPLPWSYGNRYQHAYSSQADYLLAFMVDPARPGVERVATVEYGAVYRIHKRNH